MNQRVNVNVAIVLLVFCAGSSTVSGQSTESAAERYSTGKAVLKIMEQREVPCRAAGVIQTSHLQEGRMLKQGELVVQIDDRLARLEVDRLTREHQKAVKEASTRVELEFHRQSVAVAKAELNRARLSNQRQPGSVAQSEIDQLTLMVQRAIAEKDKTEFEIEVRNMSAEIKQVELDAGRQKLEHHQVLSPLDGMIVEVMKQEGEWVESSQPVCRMLRLDKLKTEVKVPAEIALDDLIDAPAEFFPELTSLAGKAFVGRVIFVDPEANPVDASVKVWVEIDNPDLELVAGLTGRLVIKQN